MISDNNCFQRSDRIKVFRAKILKNMMSPEHQTFENCLFALPGPYSSTGASMHQLWLDWWDKSVVKVYFVYMHTCLKYFSSWCLPNCHSLARSTLEMVDSRNRLWSMSAPVIRSRKSEDHKWKCMTEAKWKKVIVRYDWFTKANTCTLLARMDAYHKYFIGCIDAYHMQAHSVWGHPHHEKVFLCTLPTQQSMVWWSML